MCQLSLQFIVGCVQSSSNEITLLKTDSTDYITKAQMQYGIASVRSAEISGFDSKAFFRFISAFCVLNEMKILRKYGHGLHCKHI